MLMIVFNPYLTYWWKGPLSDDVCVCVCRLFVASDNVKICDSVGTVEADYQMGIVTLSQIEDGRLHIGKHWFLPQMSKASKNQNDVNAMLKSSYCHISVHNQSKSFHILSL